MTITANLQHILFLSHRIVTQQYANHISALKNEVPSQLQTLIQLVQEANFSRPIRVVIEDNILPSFREKLAEIQHFNKKNNTSDAEELIRCCRSEIEIARIFFEGLYKYLSTRPN